MKLLSVKDCQISFLSQLRMLTFLSAVLAVSVNLPAQISVPPLITVEVTPESAYVYGCCETHLWPGPNFQVSGVTSTWNATYSTATIHVHTETSSTNPYGWADLTTSVNFNIGVLGISGESYRLTWSCIGTAEADGYVPGENLPTVVFEGCGSPLGPGGQGNFNNTVNQSGVLNGTLSGADAASYTNVAQFGQLVELTQGGHRSSDWTITISVQIVRTNQGVPTAIIAPVVAADIGTPVTLDGSQSHANTPGSSLVAYSWTISNPTGTNSATGPQVQYTWSAAGIYLVTLTVTDTDGLTGTTSIDVSVGNHPPQCTGLPILKGVDASSIHIGLNHELYDGTEYHYGLVSQDPSDSADCTFGGRVEETVVTHFDSCMPRIGFRGRGGGPHHTHLTVQTDPEASGFHSWIPDEIAAPEKNLAQSCETHSTQRLEWIGSHRRRSVLTPRNQIDIVITIDRNKGSQITTTSFGVPNTTTYFLSP